MCALPAAGKTKCGKCAMLEGKHPIVFMIFVWNRAGRNNGLKQEAFAGQKNIYPVPPQAVLNVDVLLQEVIARSKGRANKDLGNFADQIKQLIDRWDV